MPDIEFRLQQDQFAVRGAVLQFIARRGYSLGRKPEYHRSVVVEHRAAIEEIDVTESEKYHYRRDPSKQGTIILSVRVDFFRPRDASGTVVRLRFEDTRLDAAMAYEVQGYLLDSRSYTPACPQVCPNCSSAVRNITARYCGKCGECLVTEEPSFELPSSHVVEVDRKQIAEDIR